MGKPHCRSTKAFCDYQHRSKSKQDFYTNVVGHLDQTSKRNIFVFIHGYDTTFEEAAKRTAQIAYDLQFDGPPIFYSWPSQGNKWPLSYFRDEQDIEWSRMVEHVMLIENFAPGTVDRLGIGYDICSRINPKIVYCSLKGFMPGLMKSAQL